MDAFLASPVSKPSLTDVVTGQLLDVVVWGVSDARITALVGWAGNKFK
jgi:hypothetical protein